jgi:hypothetical protein
MAAPEAFPLLVLPPGTLLPSEALEPRGGGASPPKKARQIQRLGPAFQQLRRAFESAAATLTDNTTGAGPEHVLVFETNGPVKELLDLVAAIPELEWLLDYDEKVDQDDDFRMKGAPARLLTATIYMVVFNQGTLQTLLSAWQAYSTKRRAPRQFGVWGKVFRQLRTIRRWGPVDRLRELEVLRDLLEPVDPKQRIRIEIDLWPKSSDRRQQAEDRLRRLVEAVNGKVLHTSSIPEIRYHGLLVELPHEYFKTLLAAQDVDLLLADEIYLIRPTAQAVTTVDNTFDHVGKTRSASIEFEEPICAVLDGLPMENHPHLQDQLLVDDPDLWSETYPAASRRHGTAMASLVLHGDQHERGAPLRRRLYIRPILKPNSKGEEKPPQDRLWVDLVHEAVRRIVASDAVPAPVAPSVRIVNLSVGDVGRPFLHEPSPFARLLDWLAWKHRVLFIVSAGNHAEDLPSECSDDQEALRHIFRERRHRRLLSPAEHINGLTVGATNHDGAPEHAGEPQRAIPQGAHLPSVYSALGMGVRRSVKPDLLAPGGRVLFQPRLPGRDSPWTPSKRQKVGQLVAVPGSPGESKVTFLSGTSNAAALVSRAACLAHESIAQLLAGDDAVHLRGVPIAVLTKALVVHSAEWPADVRSFVHAALGGLLQPRRETEDLAGILGFGHLREDRVLGCDPNRATAIGGGEVIPGERIEHRVPIPEAMHLHQGWRRLTATLAWFSPINPSNRKYRCARLALVDLRGTSLPLAVDRAQAHGQTAARGTVQHVVLDGSDATMSIGPSDDLRLVVECSEDAPSLTTPIPYSLVVSIEANAGAALQIYEGVATRLLAARVRTRPAVSVRPGP